MIIGLVTLVHIIVCLILIISVLLQSGKGADLAGAFGGGGSQTAFGSRGPATFLSRVTTVAAITFMVTSLTLAVFRSPVLGPSSSAVPAEDPNPVQTPAPAVPTTIPAAPGQPPPGDPGATPPAADPNVPAQPPASSPPER